MSQFLYKSKFTVYETIIFIYSNCPLRKIVSKEHRRLKCTAFFFIYVMISKSSLLGK